MAGRWPGRWEISGIYEQVVQKRGQPLREGFTIVKVRAARARFDEL